MYSQLKRSISLGAAPLVLAGCSDPEPEPEATESPAVQTGGMDGVADMPMEQDESETVTAKSTGTITAIDAEAGRVTLDHAAIPAAEWPAMKMAFDVDPTLLGDLAVGDRVAFDVEISGSSGKVTAISKD